MRKYRIITCCILLCAILSSCNINNSSKTRHYSDRAEDYAIYVKDYDPDTAEYYAFCEGFDSGWDQHSEEHDEDKAREQGIEDGYSEGYSDGYNEGYEDGNDAGKNYVRYDDDDFKADIRSDAFEEIKQSFNDEYSTGLCDGYNEGYTDAKDEKESQYELFEYTWIDSIDENIGYISGYEIGYVIGYRDCKAGISYDMSFDY